MTILMVLALSALMALATWFAGWWAVLLLAFVAGVTWRAARVAAWSACAAALAWAALLAIDAGGGRLGALAGMLGGVFPVPGVALLLVTLLFPAAGAWAAAVLGSLCRETVSALRTTRNAG